MCVAVECLNTSQSDELPHRWSAQSLSSSSVRGTPASPSGRYADEYTSNAGTTIACFDCVVKLGGSARKAAWRPSLGHRSTSHTKKWEAVTAATARLRSRFTGYGSVGRPRRICSCSGGGAPARNAAADLRTLASPSSVVTHTAADAGPPHRSRSWPNIACRSSLHCVTRHTLNSPLGAATATRATDLRRSFFSAT